MKWQALATDFDGTIATDGVVDEPTRFALTRLRSENVRTFLVTGRELSDFKAMGSFLSIFDMIIAENGAVLYDPGSGETRALCAVAVANALPSLKDKAALITRHSAGAGVTELIDSALRGELDGHIRVESLQ